ncbi:MAG: hypothetical protein R8M38_10390 [Mariprofundaceae bacterium]
MAAPYWSLHKVVAGMQLHIDGSSLDCRDEITALLSLFPDRFVRVGTKTSNDMCFHVRRSGEKVLLLDDKQQLYCTADHSGDIVAAFEWAFYKHTLDAINPELLSIHASTVKVDQRLITFAGISGAGKSSLCTAALLQYAHYLTDEFTLLDESGCIVPFPRPLQWGIEKHPAFDTHAMLASGLFTRAFYDFTHQHGDTLRSWLWLPKHIEGNRQPADIMILPRYDPHAPTADIQPLRRGQAIIELAHLIQQPISIATSVKELHRRLPRKTLFYRLHFSSAKAAIFLLIETN